MLVMVVVDEGWSWYSLVNAVNESRRGEVPVASSWPGQARSRLEGYREEACGRKVVEAPIESPVEATSSRP
jgi:hypothetical protein